MTVETWVIYVATVFALMSTPGPSQLLMLSNSGTHGFLRALSTAAGDLSANMLQMLAAGLGLAAVIAASATALSVIKWAGVAYLIWLGARMILKAKANDPNAQIMRAEVSAKTLWMQGFITSAANPKAVVFFRRTLSAVHFSRGSVLAAIPDLVCHLSRDGWRVPLCLWRQCKLDRGTVQRRGQTLD